MFAKHILSKIDFQRFSLIESSSINGDQAQTQLKNDILAETDFYLDELKKLPTIMRKTTANSKSEAYRLIKEENLRSFEKVREKTDLHFVSFIIDWFGRNRSIVRLFGLVLFLLILLFILQKKDRLNKEKKRKVTKHLLVEDWNLPMKLNSNVFRMESLIYFVLLLSWHDSNSWPHSFLRFLFVSIRWLFDSRNVD